MKKVPNRIITIVVFIFGICIFTSPIQYNVHVIPSLNDDISILEITKPDRDLMASYLYTVDDNQKEYFVRMIIDAVLSEDFPNSVEEVLLTVDPFATMKPVKCEADSEFCAMLETILYY